MLFCTAFQSISIFKKINNQFLINLNKKNGIIKKHNLIPDEKKNLLDNFYSIKCILCKQELLKSFKRKLYQHERKRERNKYQTTRLYFVNNAFVLTDAMQRERMKCSTCCRIFKLLWTLLLHNSYCTRVRRKERCYEMPLPVS